MASIIVKHFTLQIRTIFNNNSILSITLVLLPLLKMNWCKTIHYFRINVILFIIKKFKKKPIYMIFKCIFI